MSTDTHKYNSVEQSDSDDEDDIDNNKTNIESGCNFCRKYMIYVIGMMLIPLILIILFQSTANSSSDPKNGNTINDWINISAINTKCKLNGYDFSSSNIDDSLPAICQKNECKIHSNYRNGSKITDGLFESDWIQHYLLSFKWLNNSWNEYFNDSDIAETSKINKNTKIILLCSDDHCFQNTLNYNQSLPDNKKIIFQFSDEGFNSFNLIKSAMDNNKIVHLFRNYGTTKFCDHKFKDKLTVIPLGYSKGYYYDKNHSKRNDYDSINYIKSSERKYEWVFIGNIRSKPWRQKMLDSMPINLKEVKHITSNFNSPDMQFIGDVRSKYLINSIYCPSPKGWWSPDSFRFIESIESGCIPIIDGYEHYFYAFFKYFNLNIEDFGIVKIDTIDDKYNGLRKYINKELENKSHIDIQQGKMMKNYNNFKNTLQNHIEKILIDFCCDA